MLRTKELRSVIDVLDDSMTYDYKVTDNDRK